MNLLEQLALTNADPALVAQLTAMLAQKEELIAAKEAQLHLLQRQQDALSAAGHAKDIKIKALTLELAHHKRIRFGKASEAYSGEQLDMFNEAGDADLAALEAELEVLQAPRPTQARSRAGRQPLPSELPRIEHRHEPASCLCAACGHDLIKIGEDVSEQLDVESARFFVHHLWPYRTETRSCKSVPLRRCRAMLCEFPATPHSPSICLPRLRHSHRSSDPASSDRRRPDRT